MQHSLVYSHISAYRLVMNLLYGFGYRRRFKPVTDNIGPEVKSVCELCFGDTIVAQWCRQRSISWTGIDVNSHFCKVANKQGFNAIQGDIMSMEFPLADQYVLAGSLYHFHQQIDVLFDRISSKTNRLILSEPVINLSSSNSIIGRVARKLANPGTGPAAFRFNEKSLIDTLKHEQARTQCSFRVISRGRDLVVEICFRQMEQANMPASQIEASALE